MTAQTRALGALLTAELQAYGYGPIAAEALGRSWAHLAEDRDWPANEVRTLARECAAAGILPDTVRAVTELTGKIISVPAPARKPATSRKGGAANTLFGPGGALAPRDKGAGS